MHDSEMSMRTGVSVKGSYAQKFRMQRDAQNQKELENKLKEEIEQSKENEKSDKI